MLKLLAYLNSISPTQQAEFAKRCGTSVGYLRKAVCKGQQLGEALCIKLERESARAVTCEELRPDVDWAYLRGSAPIVASQRTEPALVRSEHAAAVGRTLRAISTDRPGRDTNDRPRAGEGG